MSEQPSLGVRLMAQRDGWRARAKQAEAAMAVVRTLALEHVEHADGCGLLADQLLAALDAQRSAEGAHINEGDQP